MRLLYALAAHSLTGLRVAAAPVLIWSVLAGRFGAAFLVFAIAAASDVADGWVARRLGTASETGRWFDHLADIVLLLCGYLALVLRGISPLWVPISIVAAFSYYVGDSVWRSETRSLIGSRLGHLSGVLNYGILGGVLMDAALDGTLVPVEVRDLAFASVPIYSAAAILGRALSGRGAGAAT